MKYLLIICVALASCSSLRKSVNQQKQEVNKSSYSFNDSAGSTSIDTFSQKTLIEWIAASTDSSYDKVTEEVITEVIDSAVIHRETKRVIKEKGQKRTEQSTAIVQKDSSGKQIREQATIKQEEKKDSSVVSMIKNKDIKRTSFLPWWIWLIAAIIAGVAWWKRNPIIDFLTK